jgi:hypothetical protein
MCDALSEVRRTSLAVVGKLAELALNYGACDKRGRLTNIALLSLRAFER